MLRLAIPRASRLRAATSRASAVRSLSVPTLDTPPQLPPVDDPVERVRTPGRSRFRFASTRKNPHLARLTFRQIFDAKIDQLADEIANLTLLETNDLTDCLKVKLGFPADFDVLGGLSSGGGGGGGGGGGAAEEEEVVKEKTVFDVQLDGFDAKAKIKVIKEVRSVTGLGLKEAKDAVESAPTIISKALKKEEAEELLKKLEELGAKVSLV